MKYTKMRVLSDVMKSGSKVKVVFAMSPCRLVYSDDVAEVLDAPFLRSELVKGITRNRS